jgi:hypothetical protein
MPEVDQEPLVNGSYLSYNLVFLFRLGDLRLEFINAVHLSCDVLG